MPKNIAIWLVIGGIGIDLIDALTTKPGATGGVFYNSTNGYIKGMSWGKFTLGETVAAVGAGMLLFKEL